MVGDFIFTQQDTSNLKQKKNIQLFSSKNGLAATIVQIVIQLFLYFTTDRKEDHLKRRLKCETDRDEK